MSDRGNYRSIFCAIVDGPDFQAFTPGAKLVFYTLKMTLGPSGIDVVPALVASLEERIGLEAARVEKALVELEAAGWLKRERNVVWIVDGLAHEPSLQLTNANHRRRIAAHVNGLPRLGIIDAFRTHYGLAAEPSKVLSDMPSMMPSKGASVITEEGKGEGRRRRKTETSAASASAGLSAKSASGRPTWLTPFADAWKARYGGTMAAGRAVQSLRQLVDAEGADEVLRRWVIYLDATAAEYANAPRFAQTWGHWAAPPTPRLVGAPSAGDSARGEAMTLVARIAMLTVAQNVPGQGIKRFIRTADIEPLGPDVVTAFRTLGMARFLEPDDKGFLARDFATALSEARRPPHANGSTPEPAHA